MKISELLSETSNITKVKSNVDWQNLGFSVRSDIIWPAMMTESADAEQSISFKMWLNDQREQQDIPKKNAECVLAMIVRMNNKIVVFHGNANYVDQDKEYYYLEIESGTHRYSKNNQIVFDDIKSFEKFMMILTLKYKNSDTDIEVEQKPVMETWSQKYKRSIDCSNPRGFSQRAHCQGRKKKNK